MNPTPYISRSEAASLLSVSLRTLDRYIRRKGVKTKREGKNLLLLRSDITRLVPNEPVDSDVLSDTYDLPSSHDQRLTHPNIPTVMHQFELVRKLFEDAQKQLERKEERIEMLNYKLGQLETKLKTAPQLISGETAKEHEEQIRSLQQRLFFLRIRKNVYLILFLLMAIVLPFVLFLLNRL